MGRRGVLGVLGGLILAGCVDYPLMPLSEGPAGSSSSPAPTQASAQAPVVAIPWVRDFGLSSIDGDGFFAVAATLDAGAEVLFTRHGDFLWKKVGEATISGKVVPVYNLVNGQGLYVLRAQDVETDPATGRLRVGAASSDPLNDPPGMVLRVGLERDGAFTGADKLVPGRIRGILGESVLGQVASWSVAQFAPYEARDEDNDSDLAIARFFASPPLLAASFGPPVFAMASGSYLVVADSLRNWFLGSRDPAKRDVPHVRPPGSYVDASPIAKPEVGLSGSGYFVLAKISAPQQIGDLVFTRDGSFRWSLEASDSVVTAQDMLKLGPSTVAGRLRLVNALGYYVMALTGDLRSGSYLAPGVQSWNGGSLEALAAEPLRSDAGTGQGAGMGFKPLIFPLLADSNGAFAVNADLLCHVGFTAAGLVRRVDAPLAPDSSYGFETTGRLALGAAGTTGSVTGREAYDKYLAIAQVTAPEGLLAVSGGFAWQAGAGTLRIGAASASNGVQVVAGPTP